MLERAKRLKGEKTKNEDKVKSVWAAGRASIEHRTGSQKKRSLKKETRNDHQRNRMCDCLDVPGESAKEDDKERDNFGEIQWT